MLVVQIEGKYDIGVEGGVFINGKDGIEYLRQPRVWVW